VTTWLITVCVLRSRHYTVYRMTRRHDVTSGVTRWLIIVCVLRSRHYIYGIKYSLQDERRHDVTSGVTTWLITVCVLRSRHYIYGIHRTLYRMIAGMTSHPA
jgi:hypothetical protein